MRLRIADCGLRIGRDNGWAHHAQSAIRNPQSAIGFTLVEVLVVLAILGITAAAVVPAFARVTEEDEVTRAAGEFARVLASGRAAALARAASVRVSLVPETGRYWIRLAAGDETVVVDSGAITLDKGSRLASPAARTEFRIGALGVMDGDSLLVLGPSGARAIVWDRWTGEVRADPR